MIALNLRDQPFLCTRGAIYDNMESYVNGSNVNGLAGGTSWASSYADRAAYVGIQMIDDLDTYSPGAVDGLNGGIGFPSTASYVARDNYIGMTNQDDLESYGVGAVNGLNGGTGWAGSYVDR